MLDVSTGVYLDKNSLQDFIEKAIKLDITDVCSTSFSKRKPLSYVEDGIQKTASFHSIELSVVFTAFSSDKSYILRFSQVVYTDIEPEINRKSVECRDMINAVKTVCKTQLKAAGFNVEDGMLNWK